MGVVLNERLGVVCWDIESEDVQGCWNAFDEKLVTVVFNSYFNPLHKISYIDRVPYFH